MASSDKKISVKLLVDKERSVVILAEANVDFVDILLSFLTMPIGTIIRLLNKDLPIGCIANLYRSVENLDCKHFQTEACKSMLLRPLNAAGKYCENIVLNIDDTKQRRFFTCKKEECCSGETCFYSSVPDYCCSCGNQMNHIGEWMKQDRDGKGDGVFVKASLRFIISDDLNILPNTTTVLLNLLDKLQVKDRSPLEERIFDFGLEEILNLLQKSLGSNTPLTNVCFTESAPNDDTTKVNDKFQMIPKSENDCDSECKEVKVKLLLTKNENKVVHMEGGEEMVDFLFSFLTFPHGTVIKFLSKNSPIGCLDNLSTSIEQMLVRGNDCFKSEKCKMMLLSPKLPPFFSCKNLIVLADEVVVSDGHSVRGCYTCFVKKGSLACLFGNCPHGVVTAKFLEFNPKLPNNSLEIGGGFAKRVSNFAVTDDLNVTPVSPFSTVHIINELEIPITNLLEKEVSIDQSQALNLLKAAFASETALTSAFCPKAPKRRRSII